MGHSCTKNYNAKYDIGAIKQPWCNCVLLSSLLSATKDEVKKVENYTKSKLPLQNAGTKRRNTDRQS